MALPTIPTSFVPYSASASTRRFTSDFTGAFAFLGYGVLVIMFIISVSVFFYGQMLKSTLATKDAQIEQKRSSVDTAAVQGYVALHDRLISTKSLLAGHVAFSGFFEKIGTFLPTTVRFSSMHILITEGGTDAGVPKLTASGIAKNFNALAVLSKSFADGGPVKDAIFSKININADKTVSFELSASLDPKIIAFSATGASAAATTPVNTTTTP